MDKPMSDLHFKAMTWTFKVRDLVAPRGKVLREVRIARGSHVLDFGCGPGGYVKHAAEMVGDSGKVYALDVHPLAIKAVENMIAKKGMTNVEVIHSDCDTGLPDNSVDVILLYDTFHDLGDPDAVLAELYRVLRPAGVLSFSDHHLKEDEIVSKVTAKDLFRLKEKGKITYSFVKENSSVYPERRPAKDRITSFWRVR